MRVVPRSSFRGSAPPAPAPYAAAAEADFADAKAYLSSVKARQMAENNLNRELQRRGRALMDKLLQRHLEQRSPGEAADPVKSGTGVERPDLRVHRRRLETTFGTVGVKRVCYARPGHASLHPLEATLNLPPERYSLEVRHRVAETASSGSFDNALHELSRHTGAEAPKRQAEQLAVRAAEDFDAFNEAHRAAAGEPRPEGSVVVLTFSNENHLLPPRPQLRAHPYARHHHNVHCELLRSTRPVRAGFSATATNTEHRFQQRGAQDGNADIYQEAANDRVDAGLNPRDSPFPRRQREPKFGR